MPDVISMTPAQTFDDYLFSFLNGEKQLISVLRGGSSALKILSDVYLAVLVDDTGAITEFTIERRNLNYMSTRVRVVEAHDPKTTPVQQRIAELTAAETLRTAEKQARKAVALASTPAATQE